MIGVIAFVAITNTIIGFTQEYSAEKTMESLRRMASPTTRVIRGDSLISVPTRDIVVVSVIKFNYCVLDNLPSSYTLP